MEVPVPKQEGLTLDLTGVPQKYKYGELRESTRGFSDELILGKGGFGVVYKGTLTSGIQVAIKRMSRDATRRHGEKAFKSEVVIISQVWHRNLIKLRGYCADSRRKEYMLVYDLMPNGSLEDVLFKPTQGTTSLSWPQKFKILAGAADGLDYLHQGLTQQVIHRDIKCSNILLDKDWNAKLGDFGVARLVDHKRKPVSTQMAGTPGYIAPEVYSEQQFSAKADVFAYGIMILEVACGRRVLTGASKDVGLVPWVRRAHSEGNLLSTVDKRQGDYDAKQMEMVLKVGLHCTEINPRNRPSMRDVVQMLAGVVKIPAIDILFPRRSFLSICGQWFLSTCSPFRRKTRHEQIVTKSKEHERKIAARIKEREPKMAAKRGSGKWWIRSRSGNCLLIWRGNGKCQLVLRS